MIISQMNRDGTTTMWLAVGLMIKVPTHPSQLRSEEWWDAREKRLAKMDDACRRHLRSYDNVLEQIPAGSDRTL